MLVSRPGWVGGEGGVAIDGVALAMTNLMLALVGLAIFVAPDQVRIRAVIGRSWAWKRRGPRVVWVTNVVRRP